MTCSPESCPSVASSLRSVSLRPIIFPASFLPSVSVTFTVLPGPMCFAFAAISSAWVLAFCSGLARAATPTTAAVDASRPTARSETRRCMASSVCAAGPERRQTRLLQTVAVEEVVGVEGNQSPVRMHDVHAGLLHGAHVEGPRVDELHDDHAKQVCVSKVRRHIHLRETAEQIPQRRHAGGWRVIRREQAEYAVADGFVLLEDDRVASAFDEQFRVNQPRERYDVTADLQRIGHGEAVRVTRHRQHILWLEYAGLLQNTPADLGERQPIGRRVEALETASGLHWLQCHAAHAGLRESEVDDAADLM